MYYIGPGIAGFVAYVGAYFFSIVIQLSLNSTAYALQFLTDGWSTVRDIANMAFIFILIYIAMTVMLQAETAGTIKTLAVVVVIALLVNFSFFFTRVAIDAGNILALQFYNAIPAGTLTTADGKSQPVLINGVKDLSAALMGASSPHVLLSSKMFDDATKASKDSTWGALGIFTVIYLSVAAMLWMLFFAFIQVGIKFMLRIVGLWFVLISSPLAFVARTMPKTKTYFDQWLQKLIEYSLYPAIFLFMFLILTRFADSMTKGEGGKGLFNAVSHAFDGNNMSIESTGAMGVIASVAIRMGFILALMYVALHVSEWVVKEGSGIASKVTGWSTGKAFGAAGFAGRNSFGWVGNKFATSNLGKRWEAQGGGLSRTLVRGAGAIGRGSFDVRGTRVGNVLGKLAGDVDPRTGKSQPLDFGAAGGEGGYRAAFDARVKRRKDAAASFKPSTSQLEAAQKKAIGELDETDQIVLRTHAEEYEKQLALKKDGVENKAELRAARENYKTTLKNTKVLERAKAIAGVDNDKVYADSLDQRSWRNAWKGQRLFFLSAADNEAAAQIRTGDKHEAERMNSLLKNMGVQPATIINRVANTQRGGNNDDDDTPPPTTPPGGNRRGGTPQAPAAPAARTAPTIGGGGPTSYGGTVTATLSKEDRELFRKAIKTIRTSSDINAQGFSNIARKIANGTNTVTPPHSNDNKAGEGRTAANDNKQKPLSAENHTVNLGEDKEAA